MPIKISDIADMAGVSRGTVDRVLHGRGRVDPEVEKRVLAIVQKLEYKPSRVAQQLCMQKRRIRIGVITRTDVRGFWSNLIRGLDAAAEELKEYGVSVEKRYFERFSPEEELSIINELVSSGIHGLVILPLDDDRIRARLRELIDSGIQVVFINSEIQGVEPLCYIGSDYFISGQTVAGLMHHFANGRHMQLAMFYGNQYMTSHCQRKEGFLSELQRMETPYTLVEGAEITSDAQFAYQRALGILEEYPQINAIFTIASTVAPVCQAINDAGRNGTVIHVGFGMTSATRPCLLDGSLTAAIGQEAYQQGYRPLKILLDYFSSGILPKKKRILMRNEIFIKQNCIL